MKRIILLIIITIMLCGCDKTQRDVTKHLFYPFEPWIYEKNQYDQFMQLYKQRIGADPNSGIINYQFIPYPLRVNRKDFYDSITAITFAIVNDPNRGVLVITEEWYYSIFIDHPILLKREIINTDTEKIEEHITADKTTLIEINLD